MHELLELRRTSLKTWGDLPGYQAVFGVLDDTMIDTEMAGWLHIMRYRAAFHFDMDIARKALSKLPGEPFTFLRATGRHPMDGNYELADVVMFVSIFQSYANALLLDDRFTRFRRRLDVILPAFINAADGYLMTRLRELGFTIVEPLPGAPPAG